MPDKELALEVLRQIEEAAAIIIARFDAVHQVIQKISEEMKK